MPTTPRFKLGSFPSLWFSVFIIKCGVSAYTAVPRWGQAAVLINSDLYIYGGKTDQFNAYSYTSAQNNNDLLYLSLLSPFDSDSPPWQLVASSTNITTPQGPALSWHTLSAFNTSEVLLFGGQPGPNSPTVIVDAANSALLLDVFSRLEPVWITEATGWALEPPRRIHHTAITASSGLIFIIGGEKVDGSGNALADHYVFDINTPSFSHISSGNGPPDITGHGSVILPDGKLLVFGGYCQSQSQLLPFSTIWVLDTTQPTLVWTTLPVSNSPLPSPRRAFVSVLLADGRVLIQGGSDASLQNNFPDGWILDVSQSLAVWTQIDALEQVGPRRDHFAVASGDQVIFGFGYGNSGPASAPLIVYDVPSSTFNSTFTPPSSPPTSMTMPGPSQTQGSSSPTGGHTSNGIHPTATIGSNPNGGDSGGGKDKKSTAAIVVGTVVGILSLIAVGVAGVFYIKRRRVYQEEEKRFITLNQDDENDDNSRLGAGIPVAGPIGGGHRGRNFGMFHSIGLASIVAAATGGRSIRGEQQRRDMLADEDTREFGEWNDARRRGTDDTWSLRSILGTRMRSREPSTTSTRANTPWGEKTDPFSDGAALMRDGESAYTGIATRSRPQSRREFSHSSTISRMSYSDPFSDPIQESLTPHSANVWDQKLESRHANTSLPPPALRTTFPLATDIHTLSPLSEHTSHNDPPSSVSSHANSNEQVLSPFGSMSRATSRTSFDSPHLPGSFGNSIISASAALSQPIRRSDSWWNRFSRTSFLDRTASDASRRSGGMLDIRDPNPPPRLIPINESSNSGSPEGDSPKSRRSNSITRGQALLKQSGGSKVYGAHGKSLSSIQTANSEAIERMAGTMDVIQRVRTGSHRTSGSTSTHTSIDTHSDIDGPHYTYKDDNIPLVASPTEATPAEVFDQVNASLPEPPLPGTRENIPISTSSTEPEVTDGQQSRRPKSNSAIAARIQAYERRLSLSQETPSPTNTKQHEERSKRPNQIQYGLAPRPSLFVANPDHNNRASGDS